MKKTYIILALLAVACTKIVEVETETLTKDDIVTIPYTATVSSEQTRATVDSDMMTLKFATGDKLYISCDTRSDIKGELKLTSGAGKTGMDGTVIFDGELQYSELQGVPSNNLLLNATLVGSENVGVQIEDGVVTGMKYPELKEYCSNVNDAVKKYSLLTGVGTFGNKKFPLSQHTAFLNFAVKVPISSKTTFGVFMVNDDKINGENSVLLGNFTLQSSNNFTASFVLPVAENTVLKNATINLIANPDVVRSSGGSAVTATTYTASFGGTDPKTLSPKVYNVTRNAVLNEGYVNTGLPVIDIQGVTTTQIHANKDTEYSVTLSIRGTDEYPGLSSATATIKGRGNSTWNWPKKPYKIKLSNSAGLLGMSASKHWVLLANIVDKTLMRNLVAMKIASMMTNLEWTPSCVPVELYIGGQHLGSYLLIEQVRVAENRVNITEIKPPKNGATAIAPAEGGYFMELDFHNDEPVQWEDPHGKTRNAHGSSDYDGIPFALKSPDVDDFTKNGVVSSEFAQYLNYIKQYVYDAAEALYAENFKYPGTELGYDEYIDVDSFIDYWLVFELMGNHELSNPGSVYMYKKSQGKLYAGPCWDFDWGTLTDDTGYNVALHPLTNLINWTEDSIWYGRLKEDPAFRQALGARFRELLSQFQTIPDYMDKWERQLAVSAIYNFKMWSTYQANTGNNHSINGETDMTFHNAVTHIKSVYNTRLNGVIYNTLNGF